MAGKTIVIGCKLPNGIIIEHPLNPADTVELNGKNKALILGSEYGTTEVDADFWEQWHAVNSDVGPVANNAIFVAKNTSELVAVAKELKEELTGIEPMRTDGKDTRAGKVKTASAKGD